MNRLGVRIEHTDRRLCYEREPVRRPDPRSPVWYDLIYAGTVDHDFTRDNEKDVQDRLGPSMQKAQAFSRNIKKPNAVWVKPELLAEVEYRAKSAEGKLRHPSFKGIRDDL